MKAEKLAEELVHVGQPKQLLVLKTGTELVEGSVFNKGAYDFYHKSSYQIPPATKLGLHRVTSFNELPYGRNVYLGDSILIQLGMIAKTLTEGAELSLAKAEEVERITSSSLRNLSE